MKKLYRVKEERNVLQTIKMGKINGLITYCIGTAFLGTLLKDRCDRKTKKKM
jgi:hypothetical protein